VIEQKNLSSKSSNLPETIAELRSSSVGKQSLDLVLEFLHFFGLQHTLSVFKAETKMTDITLNRDSLWNAVSAPSQEYSFRKPLLVSILEQKETDQKKERESIILPGEKSIAIPTVSEPNKEGLVDQLRHIDDLLKQLDNKQQGSPKKYADYFRFWAN
jgi:hypothetical protein